MTDQQMERRCKIYSISPDCLLDYLRRFDDWPEVFVVTDTKGPPDGAKLEEVFFDARARLFRAIVSHPDFDEVPAGEKLPYAHEWLLVTKVLMRRGPDNSYRSIAAYQDGNRVPQTQEDISTKTTDEIKAMRDNLNQILYDRNVL